MLKTTVTRTVYPMKHRHDLKPGSIERRDAAKTALTDAIFKWSQEHGQVFDFDNAQITITWSSSEVRVEAESL
jgi:hypothetical protein